jgi:AcrR family transcriptional regulator
MSPRPRTIPDEQILGAAQRTMARLGPTRLTLAEVARDAGLSPATLVQRFGSKRGMMLALWTGAVDGVDSCFTMLKAAHASPLDAVIDGATMLARGTGSAEELANHLAFLQIDVSDPEFREHMLVLSQRTEAGYRALLDEAVARQELAPCDTTRLARAVVSISGGSLIGWAVFRDGTAEAWVKADLETLLAPYRSSATRGGEARRTAGAKRSRRRGLPS